MTYMTRQGLYRANISKERKSPNKLVFSHLESKPLRPNTVMCAWTTLAARAGLKVIRMHDARHTHASIMLKQGILPKVVIGEVEPLKYLDPP